MERWVMGCWGDGVLEYWREGEAVVSAFSCVGLKEHTGCEDCNGHKAPGFLFCLLFVRSDAMPDLQVRHF